MKKRLLSLVCAAALAFGLTGCTIALTPATVGTVGGSEISSGLYLLSQYQGYYAALNAAQAQTAPEGETLPDYAGMKAADFLKQTITVTEKDGSTADHKVADYVAQEAERNLRYYVAVNQRFEALGGKLDDLTLAEAHDNAQSIWEANQDLYQANGFGLATIKTYQETLYKSDLLLDMIYGKDGTDPVSDDALLAHARDSLLYVHYAAVPIYNESTFAMSDEATNKAKAQCQAVLDALAADTDTEGDSFARFTKAVNQAMPAVYETIGNTFIEGNIAITSEFLTESTLQGYYSDAVADALRALKIGEGTLSLDTGYTIEILQRADPLETNQLDDLRDTVLYDMKGQALQDELLAEGQALPADLDAAAMKKMPASKVVMELAATAP